MTSTNSTGPLPRVAQVTAAMRGDLVARTAGSRRAELDVLRLVAPVDRRPCQRFWPAGEGAHSPRRAWLSLRQAVRGRGARVGRGPARARSGRRCAGSRFRPVREPALSGRRPGRSCLGAAGRLRSAGAGASALAVRPGGAPRRVRGGCGLPGLLRAAAGGIGLAARCSACPREGASGSVSPPVACGQGPSVAARSVTVTLAGWAPRAWPWPRRTRVLSGEMADRVGAGRGRRPALPAL